MEPGWEQARTQSQDGAGVGLEALGAPVGGEDPPQAELTPTAPAPPPPAPAACEQRPGCPVGPGGSRRQREPTFHGRVGVWAVGKHHVHVLQLQPLQGGLQTWGEESEGTVTFGTDIPGPSPGHRRLREQEKRETRPMAPGAVGLCGDTCGHVPHLR